MAQVCGLCRGEGTRRIIRTNGGLSAIVSADHHIPEPEYITVDDVECDRCKGLGAVNMRSNDTPATPGSRAAITYTLNTNHNGETIWIPITLS